MPDSLVPDFSTPDKINLLCEQMQKVEWERGKDRALIDAQANGEAPYTADEATRLRIEVNVNWGEHGKILDDANRQLESALLFKPRLAVLTAKRGPADKRVTWSETVTELFNDMFMRDELGRYWMFAIKSRNASLSLHGIGALIYTTKETVKPRFVALADLLIPTDTHCDHEDLSYFATNLNMSQGELFDMVMGDEEEGWDKKASFAILHWLQNTSNRNQDPCSYADDPEKWVDWRKQNAGFFWSNNDAVPKVQLRAFYYKDVKKKSWFRKIILRYDAYQGTDIVGVSASKTFLYQDKEPFAEKLSHFLHIQYGDSSRVPPLRHHAVKGLGVALFAPCECMNRVRCQTVQHVFQDLLTWFRIDDPNDRDRLKQFVMEQFAVVPRELSIIPKEERYQPNQPMLEMVQSQFRQLMNESSASYVRDIESGTKKEMTLGEAQIRLQQVNVQVASMLKLAYAQEVFLYAEQLRRCFMKASSVEQVERFQKECKRRGIPEDMMVPEAWRVDIEQVLGAGDQSLGQYQANLLFQHRTSFDPASQRKIERDWVTVTTGDPAKGRNLVPESPDKTTNGAIAAHNLFGTLMQGVELDPREGIDQFGYIDAMLTLMAQKVVAIRPPDMPLPGQEEIPLHYDKGDISGLANVSTNIKAHIDIFGRDPANKAQTKLFDDALNQLNNYVKAMGQQLMEREQADQQKGDPKAMADAQATMLKAQVNAKVKEDAAEQKLRITQAKFELDEARKDIATMSQLNREELKARQEMAFARIDAAIKVMQAQAQTNGSEGN